MLFCNSFEATDPSAGTCDGEGCIGGYARTVYTVKRLLRENADYNPIYLNAGDNFQGTLWYNIGRWNVTSQFLNMLPADAITLGNHEFDNGVEGCVPFLETLKSPVIVANMDDSDEPTLQNKYKKSIIIERSGRKIGVIGILLETVYNLADIGKLKFTDEVVALKSEAQKLRAQGVNIIIALTHCGYDLDQEIAKNAGSDIDVIVGSHSHTFLYTGTVPADFPFKQSSGDYPTVVTQATGHRTLIVQAASYARFVGDIRVYFDDEGEILDWEGAPIYMSADVPQDEEVSAAIVPWKEIIDVRGKVKIGSSSVSLNKESCYSAECNLGNFYCDALVHSFLSQFSYSNDDWAEVTIGVTNPGGLRTALYKGDKETLQLVESWKSLITAQGKKVLVQSRVELPLDICKSSECNLGNLISDSFVHEFLKLVPENAPYWANAAIALLTAGDMYNYLEKGPIKYEQVYNILPYESTLVMISINGSVLRDLLIAAMVDIDLENNMTSTYNFMQFSGLKIVYNLKAPFLERVKEIKVRCANCLVPKYEPLDLWKSYKIITTRYLAKNHNLLQAENQPFYFSTDLAAVLNYIKNLKTIITPIERRIVFI